MPFRSAGERLDEAAKAIGEALYCDRRNTIVKKCAILKRAETLRLEIRYIVE